jgi:hypothetical protein
MPRKSTNEKPIVVSAGAAAAAPARRKPTTKRAARVAEVAAEINATSVEPSAEPSREAIAKLAYSYWEARGYQGGSSEEDWIRAETELRATFVR